MTLLILFARKEPTRDDVSKANGLGHHQDTVLYQDAACTVVKAIWPWHYRSCPDRRCKTVTLNCFRWRLNWVLTARPQVVA